MAKKVQSMLKDAVEIWLQANLIFKKIKKHVKEQLLEYSSFISEVKTFVRKRTKFIKKYIPSFLRKTRKKKEQKKKVLKIKKNEKKKKWLIEKGFTVKLVDKKDFNELDDYRGTVVVINQAKAWGLIGDDVYSESVFKRIKVVIDQNMKI